MNYRLIKAVAASALLFAACVGAPEQGEPAADTATGSSLEAPTVTGTVETRVLLSGQNARTEEESTLVVRNQDAFASLWMSVASSPTPEVDFENNAVVASFMGRRKTGGYSVSVLRAETLSDGRVRVVLKNNAPKPGMMVTQALTSPFIVLAVPVTGYDVIVAFEN
ncbi:MAG: protease complex subunit PrcB family protein [Spirochaetia bacterium]|nr:protease complex subunit PrcB family protein [Spirochaetia bacterium]